MFSQFFHVNRQNVKILEESPIMEENADQKPKARGGRINDGFIGVRLVLLETHSAKTETTLRSLLPINRVEEVNLIDAPLDNELVVKNGVSINLTFKPRELRILNLYF